MRRLGCSNSYQRRLIRPRSAATRLQGALEEGGAVELVGGGLVGDVDDVDGEAAGNAVVGQVVGEVGGVGLGVGAAEAVLLGGVAGGIDQGVKGYTIRPWLRSAVRRMTRVGSCRYEQAAAVHLLGRCETSVTVSLTMPVCRFK